MTTSAVPWLDRLRRLTASHGPLRPGHGLVSGVVALVLAVLCVLGVLAFHLPAYLTTPELRRSYDVDSLRLLLLVAMVVAGGLSLANVLLGRARWIAGCGLALVLAAAALGGPFVPIDDFPDHTPYLGLDWMILDLLGSTLVFVAIERLVPLDRAKPIFRAEWQADFLHFAVNHLLIGVFLLATNALVHRGFDWAISARFQQAVRALPFPLELVVILLVADLVQYWTHRAYHTVPWLWRLHAVHHSAKTLDWIAGSRQHVIEVLITRTAILAPIVVLGFSKPVIDAYIVIVGFQAVFNHANVDVRLGALSRLLVTPNFHHWHHSQEREALDRNYAAHFAFLDHLFGTAARVDRQWPRHYGVKGDYMPSDFLGQQAFPFTWDGDERAGV